MRRLATARSASVAGRRHPLGAALGVCGVMALVASLLGATVPAGAVTKDVATAGSVAVVAPATGTRTVWIPVTVLEPAARALVVSYKVHAISAVVGRDVAAKSGKVTFPAGSTEAFVAVTVLSSHVAPVTPCWAQVGSTCATFRLALTAISAGVSIAAAPSTDAIVWSAPRPMGVSVGDAYMPAGAAGTGRTIRVPVTLAVPVAHRVTVRYALAGGGAVAGIDFEQQSGTVRFAPRATTASVAVTLLDSTGTQPDEPLFVTLSRPIGTTLGRASGTAILATNAPGVGDLVAPQYRSATFSQVVSSGSGKSDAYSIEPAGTASTTMSAQGVIIGGNDRVVFWPAGEGPRADEQSCATWSSEQPAQGPGVETQQGLVLRVATTDGVTRGITITKNIFSDAFYLLNVHVWDLANVVSFKEVTQFDLASYFSQVGSSSLPWNVCARVVGNTVQAELWVKGSTPPAWGDTLQGGTAQLPSGWDYRGEAGFYIGHLATGSSAVYDHEYAGAVTGSPIA